MRALCYRLISLIFLFSVKNVFSQNDAELDGNPSFLSGFSRELGKRAAGVPVERPSRPVLAANSPDDYDQGDSVDWVEKIDGRPFRGKVPQAAGLSRPRKNEVTCSKWIGKILKCLAKNGIVISDINEVPAELDVVHQSVQYVPKFCEDWINPILNCMKNVTKVVYKNGFADCTHHMLATVNEHVNSLLTAEYHCGKGQSSLIQNGNCLRRVAVTISKEYRNCEGEAERAAKNRFFDDLTLDYYRTYNTELYDCVARALQPCGDGGASQRHIEGLRDFMDARWSVIYDTKREGQRKPGNGCGIFGISTSILATLLYMIY